MTLTDPRDALADQSNFIGYLVGLAGLGQMVHTLAADRGRRTGNAGGANDFVHMLLGLASLGAAIERFANPSATQQNSTAGAPPPAASTVRWLR